MKKLLATTAIAMVAMAGSASAQSVLERVLAKIDNSTNLASVNGTFANIAENLGGTATVNVFSNSSGDVISADEYAVLAATDDTTDYTTLATATGTVWVNNGAQTYITNAEYDALSSADQAAYVDGNGYKINDDLKIISLTAFSTLPTADPSAGYTVTAIAVAGLSGVDGSINNAIEGVTTAVADASQSASAGSTVAYQFDLPTYDLGALSTTALGAVNTGTITLGVNSTVDDAKTSSTQAVSSVMSQLGGSADTGAIVLNVASNMTGVNGSINNTMNNVNGAMASASTTALGAVNTGIITSGVNAAVQGIVGTSGQTNGVAP